MEVLVQLWDVGGQNLGGKMLENYVAGAQAVLFVYDSTNSKSLDDLSDWYDSVQRIFVDREQRLPAMALVANKRVRIFFYNKFFEFLKHNSHVLRVKNRFFKIISNIVFDKPIFYNPFL